MGVLQPSNRVPLDLIDADHLDHAPHGSEDLACTWRALLAFGIESHESSVEYLVYPLGCQLGDLAVDREAGEGVQVGHQFVRVRK